MTEKNLSIIGLAKRLSIDDRLFADQYIIDRNGTRAWLEAHPNCVSRNAAAVSASAKLTEPHILEYIEARLGLISADAELSAAAVLYVDKAILHSDVRKLFNDDFTLISPNDLPDDIAPAISGIDIKEKPFFDDDGKPMGVEKTYKYKFWNKDKSIDRLGKYFGIYNDVLFVEGAEKLTERMASANKRVADKRAAMLEEGGQ